MDYARPVRSCGRGTVPWGLILSRRRVRDFIGTDPADLIGRRLPARGIGALLQAHMRLTLDEAPHLSPEQRMVAIAAAVDMALAALAAEAPAS